MTDDPTPPIPDPTQDAGEPACLLHRVCPTCGALAQHDPPTVCARCGSAIERE